MSIAAKLAGAVLPFAHLLGVRAAKAEDDEDDEKKKKDEAKKAKAESDDEDDEKKPKSKAKADDDETDDDGNEVEDDEKKSKKAKSKAKVDDDSDDSDMKKAAAFDRAAAIMAHGLAAQGITEGPAVQALALAFNSDMPQAAAIATLQAGVPSTPRTGAQKLADRMHAEADRIPVVASEDDAPAAGSVQATVALMQAAMAKARGKA